MVFQLVINVKSKFFSKMLTVMRGQEWKDVRSSVTPTFTTGKIKRVLSHGQIFFLHCFLIYLFTLFEDVGDN